MPAVSDRSRRADVVRVRMFVDDVTRIGLWPDSTECDDVDLPLPEDVRARVQAWADEYADKIGDPTFEWTLDYVYDHDRRGYKLSAEVGKALGEQFEVVYEFGTRRLREEVRSHPL